MYVSSTDTCDRIIWCVYHLEWFGYIFRWSVYHHMWLWLWSMHQCVNGNGYNITCIRAVYMSMGGDDDYGIIWIHDKH